MDRLDTHKDAWREAELKIDLGTDLPLPEAVNLKVIPTVYKIFILKFVILTNVIIYL